MPLDNTMDDHKSKALAAALAQIEKQFGKGSIMKLGERGDVGVAAIPTGALALDLALGIGGLPRGRVVEISGTEGTLVLPDPNGFEGTIRVWRPGMDEESEAEAYPAIGSTFSRGAGVVELARAIRIDP